MQPLTVATNPALTQCSAAVLASVPPVMWFLRGQVERYRAKGLSVSQYRVLCVVSRLDSATLSEVAANLGMGLPMVSRVVAKLSARALLKAVECADDRRCRRLELTRTGQQLVDKSQESIRGAIAERMESLSAAECKQIVSALGVLDRVFSPASSK